MQITRKRIEGNSITPSSICRTDYKPTAAQNRILSSFREHSYLISVTKACATCKVGRRTYYDWFDNPAFCQWWLDQAHRHFALQLPRIHGAVLRGATEEDAPGNPMDRRTFLERFDEGFAPRSRQHHKHEGQMGLDLKNLPKEELEAIAYATDWDTTKDGRGPSEGSVGISKV